MVSEARDRIHTLASAYERGVDRAAETTVRREQHEQVLLALRLVGRLCSPRNDETKRTHTHTQPRTRKRCHQLNHGSARVRE